MPVAPDGTNWSIRRRWVRRPRWREFRVFPDLPMFDFSLTGALFWIAAVAVLTVLVLLLLPILVFVVELALIGLAIPARFLLGRPWTIEASSSRGDELEWSVSGWQRSRRFIRDLTTAIERGERISDDWTPSTP